MRLIWQFQKENTSRLWQSGLCPTESLCHNKSVVFLSVWREFTSASAGAGFTFYMTCPLFGQSSEALCAWSKEHGQMPPFSEDSLSFFFSLRKLFWDLLPSSKIKQYPSWHPERLYSSTCESELTSSDGGRVHLHAFLLKKDANNRRVGAMLQREAGLKQDEIKRTNQSPQGRWGPLPTVDR